MSKNAFIAISLILLLALSTLGAFIMPLRADPAQTITSSPTGGFVFTEVTLEGTGWLPLATVKIYFNSTAKGIFEFIKDVTTNATGGFKTTALVPPVPPDGYTWYAFIPATAYAAKTGFTVSAGIGVTPEEGPVGSTIRIAGSASEWVGGKVVSIIFDKNGNGMLDASEILKNVTATAMGVIDTTIIVPDVETGTYYISANKTSYSTGDSLTYVTKFYSTAFTVSQPVLESYPALGPVGASVSVEGNYFKVNYKVNITLVQDSTIKAVLATNVPTNSTGGFNVTVTIPFCTKAGSYSINATDGINYPSTLPSFTVLSPIITVSPTSAKVGESITVEGMDFAILRPVTIYFSINRDGTYELIPVATVMTNATGGFKTTVTVPPVPSDNPTDIVQVNATDTCNFDTEDFDVEAAITLSPARGKAGVTNVTVTGTGFRNETTVDITFDTTPVKMNVPTDKYGSFTAEFTVPAGIPDGAYTVTATDEKGNTASASFQVIAVEFQLILEAIQEVEEKLDYIKPKIDSLVTALSTVDLKLDAITYRIGSFMGTDTIASLLYAIEGKLDALPVFGDLVTKNWADLTGYIDSAKSEILTAIEGISVDLTPVLNALDAIEDKLDDAARWVSDADLSSAVSTITSAISSLNAKLGTFTGTDTVASLLYAIEGKLEAITAAQAASGSGKTDFTASGTQVIYAGSKVGTVTVSIKTSGVGYGESLVIRYYIDPANYIEKRVVSGTNTAGWTDTAAAVKVELVYTWRSGTDSVYWAYSVIYPPS